MLAVVSKEAIRESRAARWVLPGAAVLAGVLLFQALSLDGWQGVMLPLLSESSQTAYAPGYSYFAFRRVRAAMTSAEVTKLIGAPLRQLPRPYGVIWVYSDSPVSSSYPCWLQIPSARGDLAQLSVKRHAGSRDGAHRVRELRGRGRSSQSDVESAAGARGLGADALRCRTGRTR